MNRKIGILGLLAIGAVVLFGSAPAEAACGTGISFGNNQGGGCGAAGYCYIVTPGGLATIQASYWSLGFGNPTAGLGTDNGTWGSSNWIVDFGFGGGLTIQGDWTESTTIDGCPNNDANAATAKMVVQFSDVAAGQAYFKTVCTQRVTSAVTQFDMRDNVGGNITLQPLGKAVIANSVRAGNEANVTIASPNFASIFQGDGTPSCTLSGVIPQYDVYKKEVARNAAAPTDRNVGSGAWTLAGTCNVGQNCPVTTTCGSTNCDAYFAVAPRYADGFTPTRVGANSTRVQAGPVLAEPPDFKVIKKSGKDIKGQ